MSIRFSDVSFIYSPKTPYEYKALSDINLEIIEGSFTCLVGKTGCGKSTLIQELNALLIPTTGEVIVGDFIISSDRKRRTKRLNPLRKKVGMVFQFSENQLFEDTVLKDVMFGPKNFGVKASEAERIAKEMLTKVGIDESYYEKSPFELSGGEKRRVAIAGILASEPDILVLDEPTAGLDPIGTKEIMSLFKELNKEGKTIILVTHDMNLVFEYADYCVVMEDGRIVKSVTPKELFLEEEEKYSLETPLISKVAKLLIDNGLPIDLENIRDIDSLVEAIKRAKKK